MCNVRTTALLLLALSAITLCSCTMARMALPTGLSAAEMPIEGKKTFGLSENFRFGPYAVSDVHRGWKTTTKWGILGFGSANAKQSYEFTLNTGCGQWTSQCAAGVKWKELKFDNFLATGGTLTSDLTSDTILMCNFESGTGSWKLAMNQSRNASAMSGILTDGISKFEVEGTHKLQGSSIPLMDPTGYVFKRNGQPIGAVEVINAGAVWMDAGLDENTKDGLANAASALQLYRDLRN